MPGILIGAYSKRALVVAPSGRLPINSIYTLKNCLLVLKKHRSGGTISGLDMNWAFSNTMYDFQEHGPRGSSHPARSIVTRILAVGMPALYTGD